MKKIIYTALAFAPVMALAQTVDGTTTSVGKTITNITRTINGIIPLLVGIAVLYFLWGIVQMVMNTGKDPKAVEIGKTHMIYGIIAIFVMLSVFGLVYWLGNAIGIGSGQNNVFLPYPTI